MDLKHDRALSSLIRSLGQPDFPEALSNFVKKIIFFDSMLVISYHKNHIPEIIYLESLTPEAHSQLYTHYIQAAYLLDPFYQAIKSGVQRGIFKLFDLAPDQFKHSSYFKEYYKDTKFIDEFVIYSGINHDTTLNICFGRSNIGCKPFSKNEMKIIKQFESTLTTLCETHWKNYQPMEGKNVNLPPVFERLRLKIYTDLGIKLSPRQAEVALLILQGHSTLSISLHLDVSKETIKVFRKQLYEKCNISSQAELFSLMLPMISLL